MLIYYYRVWCEDDSQWEFVWSETLPTTCPSNTAHTIDGAKTAIVKTTGDEPLLGADGVMLTSPQPQTTGLKLCNRDLKLKTSIVGENSFEDLKVDLTTNERIDWNEVNLVGIYKENTSGYVLVDDQADADVNAVLSVWEYAANDQVGTLTPITIEIRAGCVMVDNSIVSTEDHQVYVVAVPDLPGYEIRLFDGYVNMFGGQVVQAVENVAMRLDVSQTSAAGVIRFFFYHPAGVKLTHIVRLITYRPSGSF